MGFNEKEERQPVVSNTRIAEVVRAVIKNMGQEEKDKTRFDNLEKTMKAVKEQQDLFCDPKSGKCFVTKEILYSFLRERDNHEERLVLGPLEKMTEEKRQRMSETESRNRDEEVDARCVAMGVSETDCFRRVWNDRESQSAIADRVRKNPKTLKHLLSGLQGDQLKGCFLDSAGNLVCPGELGEGLRKKGIKIQIKDGEDWKDLTGEEKEKKERVSHF